MTTPNWAWATHQPLIQSVMEIYHPAFVLEIGVGLYSTPLFVAENTEYLGIEQNIKWIDEVKKVHPDLMIRNHGVDFESNFRYQNLNSKQLYRVNSYYLDLKQEIEEKQGVKLLFVDCYLATRLYALNILWDAFDIVIFHDSHPRSYSLYGYDRLNFKPSYQLTSKYSWTAIYFKGIIGRITLNYTLDKYIKMFEERWNVKSGMKLVLP